MLPPILLAARLLGAGLFVFSPALQDGAAALVTRERLEQHVRVLADDDLAGRLTGSPEAMVAARYLARELESFGLEPGGDEQTFLQHVPIWRLSFEALPQLVVTTTSGEQLTAVYGVDFEGLAGLPLGDELQVRLVRSARDVPGEPEGQTALFVDGSSRERREWLAESEGFGLVIRRGSARAGRERTRLPRGSRWVGEQGAPAPSLSIRGPLRERFQKGEVVSVRATVRGAVEELDAANVVGVLRGAGELASEAVIVTAHYDHIGVREPPEPPEGGEGEAAAEPDLVYNGADDDASGCAAVLELARVFAAEGAPARTLIFMLVTGEESGLLGTKYYIERPLVPLAATVCNLNFEMIGRPDELVGGSGRLWLSGHERTNLLEEFRRAGAVVAEDLRPEQRFFSRSDNYAFARLGIVAQTLSSYDLHTDYHRVTDEADTLDYEHMEAGVRAATRCLRGLADGSIRPEWKEGGDPSAGE